MATIRRTASLRTPFDFPNVSNLEKHRAPVVRSLSYRDPSLIFSALSASRRDCFQVLMDGGARQGRYAYIATDPAFVLSFDQGQCRIDGAEVPGEPFEHLEAIIRAHRLSKEPDLPPFQGGLAGYWGYELGGSLERLPDRKPVRERLPDLQVGLFDTVIAFDCMEKKSWIIGHDLDLDITRPRAFDRVQHLEEALTTVVPLEPPLDWCAGATVQSELSAEDFKALVKRTIDYIYAGDIFQANITQRFIADLPPGLDGWTLYRRLKTLTPAPYAAYLQLGQGNFIASASPECFLNVDDQGLIETKPIKGTRPRGQTASADEALKADLISSEKDRAENLMIVDLLRNDLSKVAALGTVRTPKLFDIQSFAAVHHLVSTVTATLRPDETAISLLAACFPGGSVTGAPKIRAQEIIHELEPSPRGPYCGAIGWIGFNGAMECSIVIRTLVGYGTRVVAQAGCGIVADSQPDQEWSECMDKAGALISALKGGQEHDPS